MWVFALIIFIAMITQSGKNNGGGYTPMKETRTCHWCGKEYVKPNSGRLFYCSNQCEELSKHFKK